MTFPYPVPSNEAERLQALHRLKILDGGLPAGVDRICSVAQDLFQVPVVLMVFLAESLAWIKRGYDAKLEEAPRELSFCNYTIMHDEVFVVNDAKADRRFAEHPYVTANPPLRFYAGAPFVTEPGIRIGSICLVDHVPRDFTPGHMRLLANLARLTVDELWLHQLQRTGLTSVETRALKGSGLDFRIEPVVTAAQVRAGRGMLKWSVRRLAAAAGVAPMTVKRLEADDEPLRVKDENAKAIQSALEQAGVEFLFEPGTNPGVRPR
ncbi:GAF domain-containing protein [Microvirga arsenatis]|nr:GAF domain-containing protein [Microvirga arsenatis]NBJ13127.1 GAF domain-containing protein [Microvirga arsenatis]